MMRTLATIGLACILAVSHHQLVIAADAGTDGQQLQGQDYHYDLGGFLSAGNTGSSHPASSPAAMGLQSNLTLVRRKRDINIRHIFDKLNAGTGFVSGILTIFDSLSNKISPDQAMRDGFKRMEDKLEKVSKDINRIGDKVEKESTWTRYSPDEQVIRNALKALNEYQHEYYRTNGKPYHNINLEEFSKKAKLVKDSIHNLLSGLMGNSTFGGDILETIKKDVECHGNKFWAQTEKVMTFINSGLSVYATYLGYNKIPEVTNEHFKETVVKEYAATEARAKSIQDKCKTPDKSKVEEEMRRIMEDKPHLNNAKTASAIQVFLQDKYDTQKWLVIVYNGISGFENHCMSGHFHTAFRVAGKNAAAVSANPGIRLSDSVRKAVTESGTFRWLLDRCNYDWRIRPSGFSLRPCIGDFKNGNAQSLYNFLVEDQGGSAFFAVVKRFNGIQFAYPSVTMDFKFHHGELFHVFAVPRPEPDTNAWMEAIRKRARPSEALSLCNGGYSDSWFSIRRCGGKKKGGRTYSKWLLA